MNIGNYVETVFGVNGILFRLEDKGLDKIAFIKTDDGTVIFCPTTDIKK